MSQASGRTRALCVARRGLRPAGLGSSLSLPLLSQPQDGARSLLPSWPSRQGLPRRFLELGVLWEDVSCVHGAGVGVLEEMGLGFDSDLPVAQPGRLRVPFSSSPGGGRKQRLLCGVQVSAQRVQCSEQSTPRGQPVFLGDSRMPQVLALQV